MTRSSAHRGVFVLLLAITLVAQGLYAQDFKRQYRKAKEFYTDGKYNLAMESFRPLIAYDKNNPYAEYASFYYAVSAYHQHYPAVAKDMLRQCLELYPKWDQLDQVRYWLATVYFDEREYFQALEVLQNVRDDESIKQLKLHHLKQIDDPEILRMILEDMPAEQLVAELLAVRLYNEGSSSSLREADQVIRNHGVTRTRFDAYRQQQSSRTSLRLALLMPFLTESLDPSPAPKKNQLILDLYQGMKMAVDSLKARGVEVELLAYDTRRDTAEIKRVLALEELRTVDAIIGPAFLEELPPIKQFSLQQQIPLLNPIAYSPDFIKGNSLSVLAQPSYETIGSKSADWISNHLSRRPCMVFYGESYRDSLLMAGFLREARERGLKVAHVQRVLKGGYERILPTLVKATEYDKWKNPIDFTLKRDSIQSIFVASDNELIFTKVMSAVETRNDSLIIVGQETWLDKPQLDFSKFERLHVVLAAPNFTDVYGQAYLRFRSQYLHQYGLVPASALKAGYESYARMGYEFLLNVGQAFALYGQDFLTPMLQAPAIPGHLTQGRKFEGSQDNQLVPMIYFHQGALTPWVDQ